MKKLTMLALVLMMFAGVANAQLRYGIKGGANLTDIRSKNDLIGTVDKAMHYQIGFLMQYRLGDFGIQPELLYSEKGGTLKDVYPNSSYLTAGAGLNKANPDISLVTKNIELPINFQYGLKIRQIRVYAQAGPYFSYTIGGTINDKKDLYSNVNDVFEFNKLDLGLGVGGGFEYKKFQLSARYDFGLRPVGKEYLKQFSGVNYNPFYEMKNRNLTVSLAYLF